MKILLVIFLCLISSTTSALCPSPEPKLCSRFFESDKVFIGTLIEAGFFPPNTEYYLNLPDADIWYSQQHVYRFRVLETLKGRTSAVETVLSQNTSARWVGDVGQDYVIFVRSGQTWGSCNLLDEPEYVNKVHIELEKMSKEKLSTVEGRIHPAHNEIASAGENIRVEVVGIDSSYETYTITDGSYAVVVKPGFYFVHVEGAKTYPNPYAGHEPFELTSGQCNQQDFQLEK